MPIKDRILTILATIVVLYSFLYFNGLAHLPYQNQLEKLKMITNDGASNEKSYWLTKHGFTFSSNDHVALFFGYADDKEGCDITAKLLNKKYSTPSLYTCNRIN